MLRELLQGGGDIAEGRLEGASNSLHCRENYNGDASSNQSVLHSRRARLVIPELAKISKHLCPRANLIVAGRPS